MVEEKVGDGEVLFIKGCKNTSAQTIILRGANDYLVRFAYRDAEDLERFHAEVLPRLPGVLRSNSMLVLRTVKKTTALAL